MYNQHGWKQGPHLNTQNESADLVRGSICSLEHFAVRKTWNIFFLGALLDPQFLLVILGI